MNHFQPNIFQELKEKKVLDKDGKVDALGAYGKMKLTGQEIAAYFKKNKVTDAEVKKAVGVALDLSGADSIARKEIAKYYGNAILKNKDVQKALQYANESYISNQEVESLDESLLIEKNLMPEIQKIVSDKSASKVGGVMLDMFTASMISKVYDKVNDGNKKKMESANITVLVKLAHKVMGMKEEVAEGKMGDLFLDIQQGMTAQDIAKNYPVSLQQAKEFLKDYYSQKKKPLKMGEVTEGKYAKYSDLLMKKAKLVAQGPVATKEVGDINKKIAAEIKKLGIKEGVTDDEPLKDKYPFQKKFSVESTFREMYEAELKEEMITYRVKGMQKPEEQKFTQSAKLMGLKITMDKGKKDTVIVMSGTKKKLRDFDAVARGKSSYGDPSTIKHFDEK